MSDIRFVLTIQILLILGNILCNAGTHGEGIAKIKLF